MNQGLTHPLDRLINDNSLVMLEALIPFVDMNMKKMLVLYIKYQEISRLMIRINDINYLNECGFNCNFQNSDDVLSTLCQMMPGDFSSSIANTKQMINAMSMMNQTAESAQPNIANGAEQSPAKANTNNMYTNVLKILENEGAYVHESFGQSQIQSAASTETADNIRDTEKQPETIHRRITSTGYDDQRGA